MNTAERQCPGAIYVKHVVPVKFHVSCFNCGAKKKVKVITDGATGVQSNLRMSLVVLGLLLVVNY